jgi:hypothetical protein
LKRKSYIRIICLSAYARYQSNKSYKPQVHVATPLTHFLRGAALLYRDTSQQIGSMRLPVVSATEPPTIPASPASRTAAAVPSGIIETMAFPHRAGSASMTVVDPIGLVTTQKIRRKR